MTDEQNTKLAIKTKFLIDKFFRKGKYVKMKFDSKRVLGSDNEVTNGIKDIREKISEKAAKTIKKINTIN